MAAMYAVLSSCSHFRIVEENFDDFEKARAAAEEAFCTNCQGRCGYVHIVDVPDAPPQRQ